MPESSNPFTEIFNNSNEIQEERKKAISEYNKGNYDVAFRLFSKLSKNGDSESQFYLGLMYANGQGVEQSYEEAVKWYWMSADQGDASAQYNLGLMYEDGQGVEQSYEEAVKWYRKSADQGSAQAQCNLGFMYENGYGVETSLSKALELYRQSYDNGRTGSKDDIDRLESMIDSIEGTVKNDLEKSSGYSTRPSPKAWLHASNDSKTSCPNNDSTNGFDEIFKRLTAEEFMEDPTRILSLMMDFGFDPRQVKILRMVMSEDMKEVKNFLRSPTGTGYEIAEGIAEYCLVSKDALKDILDGIRSSLNGDIKTEVIDDDRFGRCRISLDGIAKYSPDMTVLLWVKEDISEFRIPDSVTEIRQFAFSGCTSLKEVHIPDSVTEIGSGAFSYCTSVHFIVDAGNEFYCSVSGALFDKEKETLISGYALVQDGVCDIPDSVTEIGDYAFSSCTSLKEVRIPDSVTEIGCCAFDGCTSLKEVHIPDSVTGIGWHAFEGCTSVNYIVDSGNESYCSVSGALFDKKKEKLISGYALVQSGVCDIPDSVKKIGYKAFDGCSSLEDVHIPDSVTEIGCCAFEGCTSVHFIVDAGNESYCSVSGALFDKEKETLISGYALVRDGVCDIPDSVTEIGDYAFSGCTSLKEVHIPDSVRKIDGSMDRGAFSGCTSLKEVHIPDSVTEIGWSAFSGCKSLKEVRIPDSVTEIVKRAFDGCTSLKEVHIPDSVTGIGWHAFEGCTSVHFIVDPNNLASDFE